MKKLSLYISILLLITCAKEDANYQKAIELKVDEYDYNIPSHDWENGQRP